MVNYLNGQFPAWKYLDWEDHADLRALPQKDCVGIAGMGATAEDGTDTIIMTVAFSPFNDENLFRLREAVDKLYELWRKSGYTIPLYDADTTDTIGALVMTEGTMLAPLGRAELRPYQIITAHLKTALG